MYALLNYPDCAGPLFATGESLRCVSSVLPLPKTLSKIVSPFKDVEGLHFKFHYNLYHKYVSRCMSVYQAGMI